jgi:hypothetical protein
MNSRSPGFADEAHHQPQDRRDLIVAHVLIHPTASRGLGLRHPILPLGARAPGLSGWSYGPALDLRGSAQLVQELEEKVATLGQALFPKTVGQALIQSGAGAPCRGHGFLAAAGQSDTADPDVGIIRPALAVVEAFDLCHSFGGALLGHAQGV